MEGLIFQNAFFTQRTHNMCSESDHIKWFHWTDKTANCYFGSSHCDQSSNSPIKCLLGAKTSVIIIFLLMGALMTVPTQCGFSCPVDNKHKQITTACPRTEINLINPTSVSQCFSTSLPRPFSGPRISITRASKAIILNCLDGNVGLVNDSYQLSEPRKNKCWEPLV